MLTRAQRMKIEQMTFEELRLWVVENPEPKGELEEVVIGRLATFADDIGWMWDKTTGINPQAGRQVPYGGTPNHRSMTYKCRKLAGFTYP